MATVEKEPLRRVRERELIAATRALFDERGVQDAPIEEIAQAVGIARGLIYRHFSSKDELYVATVGNYLDELADDLRAAVEGVEDPVGRLEAISRAYAAYCERYPAFIDSALALMRRPATELRDLVSDAVWIRLGRGMASCIDQLAAVLREGSESGALSVEDPDFMANVLWTQGLGAMHLARIRVAVRQPAPGEPGLFPVESQDVIDACVANAMAAVGAKPAPRKS